jgi:hypothetical protein
MFFRCLMMMIASLIWQEPEVEISPIRQREDRRMELAALLTGSPWNELPVGQ